MTLAKSTLFRINSPFLSVNMTSCAAKMATLEEADNTAEMDTANDRPSRPSPVSRESSFSDTLGKLASNTFGRRRTVANIQVNNLAPSRLPIASGIARSTSFLSSVNGRGSKTNATGSGLVTSTSLVSFPSSGLRKTENQQPSAKSARLSTRIAHTPFFSRQASTPVTPEHSHHQRESSVQITQHHLMTPLGPPMPRRKTLGDVETGFSSVTSSPRTPSYARTTSSSENRRKATLGPLKENQISTPTPNHTSKTTPTTTSSGKLRSGTPHPKRTPASTSSGQSSIPIRAATKASETPTPTPADVLEHSSPGKARVSFLDADEILAPMTTGSREPQVEREIEEPQTPTPTPGNFLDEKLATLRRDLEEARLAENLAPVKAAAEEDVAEEDVAKEVESRGVTPIPQNPRHVSSSHQTTT